MKECSKLLVQLENLFLRRFFFEQNTLKAFPFTGPLIHPLVCTIIPIYTRAESRTLAVVKRPGSGHI